MQSVNAEFEQGSRWDSWMLLAGVLCVVAAFLTTLETEIWPRNDGLLKPLLAAGGFLILANVVLRLIRPKLRVTLLELQNGMLQICPVSNLQFSGWVAGKKFAVKTSALSKVRIHNFYSPATKAGMYWVCLELNDGRVVEYSIDDHDLVSQVQQFFETSLPETELDTGYRR